jgi:hypothetical protein
MKFRTVVFTAFAAALVAVATVAVAQTRERGPGEARG